MSQETVEELQKGQELLRDEVNRLKTQMSLIIKILLKEEDNPLSYQSQVCPAPQISKPWVVPSHPQQACHAPPLQQPLMRPRQNHQQQQNGYQRKNQHSLERKNVPINQMYFDLVPVLCDYHAGSPGHNVVDCRVFKYKVQELIDRKLLSFKEEPDS
ncbi:hypothetical protein A2U01_0004582 [Trifolium medium]|uniref:Gag-pol polyprotein n=1 Tax=Trifolium medium TaxID=97028 RepID=A0A392M8L0_9FABA|nr:hypothetical protein [Trifolium medium]